MASTRHSIAFFLLLVATFAAAEIKNKGWWRNTVFYQIYPRSFMDSDGDGVGDLTGIKAKLQHFVDAGIGAIWLSPINTSPMKDFGYDVSDFRDIDKTFGSMKDMEALIAEAKRLGIKVILDLVPNHTSDLHEWFQKSKKSEGKYKDYYVWANPKMVNNTRNPPNNWISVFGNTMWTYDEGRKQYFLHQFLAEQPDLNYSNPEVRSEMKYIILYWLDKGIDGFRIDAVPHIFEGNVTQDEPRSNVVGAEPNEYTYLNHTLTKDQPETYKLIEEWRQIVDEYADRYNQSEKVIMTEAYTNLRNTTKFYNHGSNVPFNFQFIMDVNADSTTRQFKNVIDAWINATPAGCVPNWVMGNHDRNRTASRYLNRADQMTMLAMILPGVTVTYNGEEIGMLNYEKISFKDTKDPQACIVGEAKYRSKSRDPARTPFQWNDALSAGFSMNARTWLPVHDNYRTLNLEKQKRDKVSHYKVYTALTKLKNSSDIVQSGSYRSFATDNLLAIVRERNDRAVVLLINFSRSTSTAVNITQIMQKPMTDAQIKVPSVGYNVEIGKNVSATSFVLPANASVVLYAERLQQSPKSGQSTSAAGNRNFLLSMLVAPLLCSLLRD